MRRLMILAALAGCTGANDAAPDERCEPFEIADMPRDARLVSVDAEDHPARYALPDGAQFDLWPGTRAPMRYLLTSEGKVAVEWGCWPGGGLAYECQGEDCTCHQAGQSWGCPWAPGEWFSAVDDAVKANGPYVPVTR